MSHFDGMNLQWLGHATVFFETSQGTSVLIDPWMESNPAYPKGLDGPKKIDLVLCTHAHKDHIGDALQVDKRYKPTFVAMNELANWFGSKDIKKAVGMNLGGTFQFQDVSVTMVEARHSSGIEDDGKLIYGGVPAGYIIRVPGEPVLYHAGDTTVFNGMKLIRELYKPEIACLPIGDHYTMGPQGAALAAEFLGVRKVIPIHYGTFPVLTGTPTELRTYLKGKPVEVVEMKPGEILR